MLTVLVSLAVYQTHQSIYGAFGIVLAMVGPTFMFYGDEKRGEADDEAEEETGEARRDEVTERTV